MAAHGTGASIPKRPLAVSRAKKKLPLSIDWGKGIPKDHLRYINAREEALIKAHRSTKAERSHAGIKAYPDPKDTAAGDPTGGRGADGPSGAGRGSSSGSSSSSTSKTSSSSSSPTGGGSKGPTSTSTTSKTSTQTASTPSGGSNSGASRASAPNAAAQAASNKLNSVSAAVRSPSSTLGGSKSPNAAAAAASSKLNATASALKTGQQPQSIQGMINSQGPVSYSGQFDNGYYHSFTDKLPGQSNPNQFDKTIGRTNMVNANHVPMDTWSKAYNANSLTPGAQKIHQAIVDNAFRTNTPVDFFSGKAARSSGTGQHPIGQAIDVRLKDPVTGAFVGTPQIGSLAANPIGNVKLEAGRTPAVAKAIQGALEGPYRQFATGVVNSFMDNPGVYGAFDNQRWGGSFNGRYGKDYMHYDEGKVTPGVSADQAALRKEAANYSSPVAGGTQFASTGGSPIQNAFTGNPSAPAPSRLASAEPSAPMPQSIPSPTGMGMLPNAIRDPAAARMAGIQQAPLAMNSMVAAGPSVSAPPSGLPSKLPGVSPNVPRTYASNANRLSSPSTWKPEAAPGDAVPADTPAIVSDNPMQGPSNPMQEGENPQVKRDRQMKYANRGATIGGIIAGPLGTVVGGTLGWQMGKTPPRQRQAIASNPQALSANVQSINTMVEERGGKGNPQMRVTDAGLRDVLTDPTKVTQSPEKYTTLEQMLAALAQGIDPDTGKPIS